MWEAVAQVLELLSAIFPHALQEAGSEVELLTTLKWEAGIIASSSLTLCGTTVAPCL